MKRLALWVLFCLMIVMTGIEAQAALDRTTLTSYSTSRDNAIGIDVGTYYYADFDANKLWYKFNTGAEGEYVFINNRVNGYGLIYISIYTEYQEELWYSNGVWSGETEIIKLDLEGNTPYYLRIYSNNGGAGTWLEAHQFAICGPNQHAGLGSAQVVRKATCTADGTSAQVCELCGGWANETVIPATGHKPGEWTTKTPATCTEEGLMVQPCMVCKEAVASNPIPAKGHLPGEWTVTLEATCSQNGIRSIQCRQCSSILENETLPLGDHKPGRMHTVAEATCMLEGRKEQRCEICNLLMAQETEAAHGHRNAKWVTLRDATCTAEGTRALRCDDCGETLNTETIVPFGHSYSEWVHRDPVCTIEGRNTQHCTVCGVELHYEVLPALGHQYTEWEVVRPATTELEGRESCHCVRCGDTQLQSIGKLNFIEGLFSK